MKSKWETKGHDRATDKRIDCSDGLKVKSPSGQDCSKRAEILRVVNFGVTNNRIYWNVSSEASAQVRDVKLGSKGTEKGRQLRACQISVCYIAFVSCTAHDSD